MNQTPSSHRPARRGAALLLVLIALAVSVLLASAFLDSRGGSVPMADGLQAASRARRAANSGLELALATIAADPNWINEHIDGFLAKDVELDGATLRVELLDLDTNAPPTSLTRMLLVNATASIDQVEISAESVLPIEATNPPVDLEFGEIALLARDEIRLSGYATLVPWLSNQTRPGTADPLLLGTLDGNAEHVRIENSAIVVDGVRLKTDARAIDAGEAVAGMRLLPEALPALGRTTPPEPNASPVQDSILVGDHIGDIDAANIRIPAGNELRINGDSILRSRNGLSVEPGARVVVESGTLILDAAGHLQIRDATIEKAPAATVILVARDRLTLNDSVIAPTGMNPDPLGTTPPTDEVARVRIIDAGEEQATISITGNTRLMATIFAPNATVSVHDTTVFYGRMMARRINLAEHSAVYAIPDNGMRIGLSATEGPHRDADSSRLHESLLAEDRTSTESMIQIAEALGASVTAGGETIEPAVPDIAIVDSPQLASDEQRPHRWRGWFGRSAHRKPWIRRSWRHR